MVIYVIYKIESFSAHYVKEHNEHVSKESLEDLEWQGDYGYVTNYKLKT